MSRGKYELYGFRIHRRVGPGIQCGHHETMGYILLKTNNLDIFFGVRNKTGRDMWTFPFRIRKHVAGNWVKKG